jgi:hypothetical protein
VLAKLATYKVVEICGHVPDCLVVGKIAIIEDCGPGTHEWVFFDSKGEDIGSFKAIFVGPASEVQSQLYQAC